MNEYKVCQSSVESLDASVWQSAAIIGLVSIGTFALIAANEPRISAVVIVGIFSTLGSFAWWQLAIRWWSVRDAKILRMRHIEQELDAPGQSHYIDYMDDLHRGRPSRPISGQDDQVQLLSRQHSIRIARARELAGLQYERRGPKDVLRWFPWITMIVWIFYVSARLATPLWQFVGIRFFVFPIWHW